MKTLLLATAAVLALGATQAHAAQIKKVTFESQGEKIVGNLYLPDDYKEGQKLPGTIVTGSWTTVKEQMSNLYAESLANRGYAALSFDFRNFGESEGKIRGFEDPQAKIEDIKAAASFLKTRPEVDAGKITGLGICASAGYVVHAAADGAFNSFATVAAWLHDPETAKTIYTPERYARLIEASERAQADYEKTGNIQYTAAMTTDMNDDLAAMRMEDPKAYYNNPELGAIPEWDNRFPVLGWKDWLTFDGLEPAARITTPYLMVHGDKMALPDNAKAFYESVPAEKKSIQWVDGGQLEHYYKPDLIKRATAFVDEHFDQTL